MTDSDTLKAIYIKLGDLGREMSEGHARIEGEINVVSERLDSLDERVKIQNGRVTKLEGQMGEMQIHARIHDKDAAQGEAKAAVISARVWAALTGSFLVILGAVIGYFL